MKIATFLITLLVNIAAGVILFFFMLIAMNGFSESDANYGIGVYLALALLVSLLMASAATGVAHVLAKREFRPWVASTVGVVVFSISGVILKSVCVIIGLLVADYVRVNY